MESNDNENEIKPKNNDNEKENVSSQSIGTYFPRRFIVITLCWCGLFAVHSMRVNVGITVVTILDEMSHSKVGTDQSRYSLPDVKWDSKMIGVLHSIFYVGFIITQIPGGFISRKMSATRIFGLSILVSSLLNALLPFTIKSRNYPFTLIVRFIQGLFEGFIFPALYRIMYLWLPNKSAHKYGGMIFGGMYAGPIVGFVMDGFIIHYWKWYFMFYIHGFIGVIWFGVWFLLIYESPSVHPTISETEYKYISSQSAEGDKASHISWKKVITSPCFISAVICNFIQSWMFILMLTNEPAYLNQFHFSLAENGIYSSIPHVLKVILAALSGYFSELILSKDLMTKTNTRKLFNTLGFGADAVSCYMLVFTSTGIQAVVFLSIGIGMSGLTVSGWQINFLDLSPEFAGVLAGISASVGTLGGILSPVIIGIMTHPQTLKNWQKSFIVTATLMLAGSAIYAVFASGDHQNWNETGEEEHLLKPKTIEQSDK